MRQVDNLPSRVQPEGTRPWFGNAKVEQPRSGKPVPERLWDWIDDSQLGPGGCWEWTAARDGSGYGIMGWTTSRGHRTFRAHRLICIAEYGPPPFDGAFAIHACDNPPCCNPAHLRWATHAENMADMAARGRGGGGRPAGVIGRCGACGEVGHTARSPRHMPRRAPIRLASRKETP